MNKYDDHDDFSVENVCVLPFWTHLQKILQLLVEVKT